MCEWCGNTTKREWDFCLSCKTSINKKDEIYFTECEECDEEYDNRERKTCPECHKADPIPQVDKPDWAPVIEQAKEYMESVCSGDYEYDWDDIEHYIFESVMEAVYGDDFFERFNNNTE